MRVFLTALVFVATAVPIPALAGKCTLVEVASADKSDLRVYFTRFVTEDKTKGRFKKCKIVEKPGKGTQAFFVTPFRQDATLVVHKSNWPKT